MDRGQQEYPPGAGMGPGWLSGAGYTVRVTPPEEEGILADAVAAAGLSGDSWPEVFAAAGFNARAVNALSRVAKRHGTGILDELVSASRAVEDRFYRALASVLGVPYRETVNAEKLVIRDKDLLNIIADSSGPRIVFSQTPEAGNEVLICPSFFRFPAMLEYFERYPSIAARVRVVSPRTLRKALLERAKPLLAERATSALFERFPQYSARIVANAPQGFGLGLFAAVTVTGLFLYPSTIIAVLHCLFSLCFLACVALRLYAAAHTRPPIVKFDIPEHPENLPVYSVLVPLYKESEVVPDLLVALGRLAWPRSKLQIKLIVEEDDHETRQALEAQELRSNIEILNVPNHGPKTKPKALSFAMPVITGEFVAVYDAEDAPHPGQLLEAWNKFNASDERLACLQAPLRIRNGRRNALTRLFAFEYSALFNGLLPALAKRKLFFPLGGTSNHFRTAALRKICNWDPFNVTEDADLAVRLCRFGYRMDVITCPTLEDAPDSLAVWIRQRTRWFKGWMQTFLVHFRNPRATLSQIKTVSYIISQILLFGMIVSSMSFLVISVVLIYLFWKFHVFYSLSHFEIALLVVDTSNILLGFSAFLLLGWRTLHIEERSGFWKTVLCTPPYWFMMSIASWRAAWQLYREPFLWEKTPHYRWSDSARTIAKPGPAMRRNP